MNGTANNKLEVENSPTILQRVIQIIKRRRINICQFFAAELNKQTGFIIIVVQTDQEKRKHPKIRVIVFKENFCMHF
jgi:acetolactate synthase small subunit